MTTIQNSDIYAQCLADKFDFALLQQDFLNAFRCTLLRDVLHVEMGSGDLFIFNYGVAIFWQVGHNQRQNMLQRLQRFTVTPSTVLHEDEFTYELNATTTNIKNDHIQLYNNERLSRLALSHAIAQSVKLGQFELRTQKTISETRHIPLNLANTGSSQLSSSSIAKMRGQLFLAKSDIMLHYDLLDVPDFFWEYPEYEPDYQKIATYLEIRQRLDVLNKRLETIHELFQMMADEQKHKHSSLLEWIVIWLIAFEAMGFLLHDILKWI